MAGTDKGFSQVSMGNSKSGGRYKISVAYLSEQALRSMHKCVVWEVAGPWGERVGCARGRTHDTPVI